MDPLPKPPPPGNERLSAEVGLLVPNRPDVIDEVFDGEAVLVNLRSGCYYALNPSASEIWALLDSAERSAEDVLREISSRYSLVAATVAAVERFVEQLQTEGLVVPRAGVTAQTSPSLPGTSAGSGFEPPEITRFDDMKDLLLLDPIHDLDLGGDGWPVSSGERRSE